MSKVKQVGTAKTELIIGQAAANLATAVKALTEGNNKLGELISTSADLALDISYFFRSN